MAGTSVPWLWAARWPTPRAWRSTAGASSPFGHLAGGQHDHDGRQRPARPKRILGHHHRRLGENADLPLGTVALTVGSDGDSTTYSGTVSAASFTKVGNGILILNGIAGPNTTGVTEVQGGTLLVNDVLQPTGHVTVDMGAALGGTGTIPNTPLSVAGTLDAGGPDGTGVLSTGSLTFSSTSTLAAQLGGTTAGTGYDQVVVGGNVDLGATTTLSLTLVPGYVPNIGDQFELIDNAGSGPVSGHFNGLVEGSLISTGGQYFSISYVGGDGNDVVLTTVAAPFAAQVNDGSARQIGSDFDHRNAFDSCHVCRRPGGRIPTVAHSGRTICDPHG